MVLCEGNVHTELYTLYDKSRAGILTTMTAIRS